MMYVLNIPLKKWYCPFQILAFKFFSNYFIAYLITQHPHVKYYFIELIQSRYLMLDYAVFVRSKYNHATEYAIQTIPAIWNLEIYQSDCQLLLNLLIVDFISYHAQIVHFLNFQCNVYFEI